MRFVAGLDGGGTKTAVTVLSLQGKRLKTAFFGAMNLNGSAASEVENAVRDSISWLAGEFGGIENFAALCIGSAGISNPEAAAFLKNCAAGNGYAGELYLLGDHEIALEGALTGRDGAVLIAGTGSVCIGRSEGISARAGGFGHLIDDEGSGYAIGRDILTAAVSSRDARNVKTCLTDAVFRRLQVKDTGQLVRFVYNKTTTKKDIAALACLLDDALMEKDAEAGRIAGRAAEELYKLARGVVEALGLQKKEIAFLGSILKNCNEINDLTKRLLTRSYPELIFTEPENDPATGAALYALKVCGRDSGGK